MLRWIVLLIVPAFFEAGLAAGSGGGHADTQFALVRGVTGSASALFGDEATAPEQETPARSTSSTQEEKPATPETADKAGAKPEKTGEAGRANKVPPQSQAAAAPQTTPETLSKAEKIARAKRNIEESEAQLAKLRAALGDPQGEYNSAEAAFIELDKELEDKNKALQKLKDDGRNTEADALQSEIENLRKKHELAKTRFDLALEERKAVNAKIQALETKIKEEKALLSRLLGEEGADQQAAAATQPATAPVAATETPAPTPQPPAQPAGPETADATSTPKAPTDQPASAGTPTAVPSPQDKPPARKEVVAAQKDAEKKEETAKKAEQEAKSISERIDALEQNIEAERALLLNARERADLESKTQSALQDELRTKQAGGGSEQEIENLRRNLVESTSRFQDARNRIREHTDRLSDLQTKRSQLQAEEIAALKEAEKKRQEFETAQKQVEALENPLSPRNILQWALDHGPKILAIIVGIVIALFLVRLLSGRLIALIAHSADGVSAEERENRSRTLVSVFQNAARVIIIAGGLAMILQEMGIPIGPLLGGAAVFGLAVAFGAQKLIRDYFHGFVILLENQYHIGDVVRVSGTAGLVERITLRMTVLRDLEGTVHFIPNGDITTVSNLTHGWSRALFEVGVAYKEDADRVIDVIKELGKELRRDPRFGPLILEDLEMLGLDALADSAIIIKFFIKTRPLKQWEVKREMLRRIKRKFDQIGIEIPFPHRTVYHRYESDEVPQGLLERQPFAQNR